MKKRGRRLTGFLLTMALAVSTVGSAAVSAAADEGFDWKMAEGTTLKILFNEHHYIEPVIAHMSEFEELTGIHVEYTVIPEGNYFDKISILLSSGSPDLDIFMTGPYQIWEYAAAGYMQDLDEFLNDPSVMDPEFDVDDFYPGILNSARWTCNAGEEMGTGGLWGLPIGYESNDLTYNKKIFEEHGIEVPTTTSELLAAAEALQKHDGENTYGIALRGELGWATLITSYMSWYASWGAKDFEVQDGKLVSCVNSPEAVEMTEWYVDLIKKGGSPTWAAATWYSAGGELGAGTAAMLCDATGNGFSQATPGSSDQAENIAYTTIPVPDATGELKSNLWTWSYAMNAASENKVAAWLFLQYFCGKEYSLKAAVERRYVCAPRESVATNPEYTALFDDVDNYVETVEETAKVTQMLYTPQPYIFEVLQEWCATIQQLVEGDYSSTQEAMDDLKETLDAIVSDVEVAG